MLNIWTCSLIFEKLLAFFSQVVSYCWLDCSQALIQSPANGEAVQKQAYPVSHISCFIHGIFSFRKFFASIVFSPKTDDWIVALRAQWKDCNMEYLKLISHVCFTLFVFFANEIFWLVFCNSKSFHLRLFSELFPS